MPKKIKRTKIKVTGKTAPVSTPRPRAARKTTASGQGQSELELDLATTKKMIDQGRDAVLAFLQQLPHAPAQNLEGAEEKARQLVEAPPVDPTPFAQLLHDLFHQYAPLSLNTAGPGYLGYIPGGGLFHAAMADFLSNTLNRCLAIPQPAPLLTQLETNTLRWLLKLMDFPVKSAKGILTTGGSQANFTALVAARVRAFPHDYTKGVMYTSEQAHQSLIKAARMMGLSPQQVRSIPCNAQMQIDLTLLEREIKRDHYKGLKPFLIVGHAGTTNSGAVDPVIQLHQLAKHHDMWLHMDGAYGGFFYLTKRGKEVLGPLSLADSLTLDPHKGLFLPYGTGALLVRDGSTLEKAFATHADYLPPSSSQQNTSGVQGGDNGEPWNFHDLSPDLSRDFRGLRLWLPLKMHGVPAFQKALDEKLDLTQWTYQRMQEMPNLEFLHPPRLSLFAFRATSTKEGETPQDIDQYNRKLLQTINDKRRVFLSGTTVNQRFYLRVCVLSFRTHKEHMQMFLEDLQSSLREMD